MTSVTAQSHKSGLAGVASSLLDEVPAAAQPR
jgi:hypothetical protein